MSTWAKEEFKTSDIGDKRLSNRLVHLATQLSESSTESIPASCSSWHETKTAYRFFDNAKVDATKILSPHIEATKERIRAQSRVLLLQDSTELDYSKHFSKEGIGFLNKEERKGLLLHPLLAITEDRLPLGLVDIAWWNRKELGQKKRSEERSIEEKETFRWLSHYREGNKLAQSIPQTHFVVIGDRESDIYEILMEATECQQTQEVHADILVRSAHDRLVETSKGKQGKLRDVVKKSKVLGEISYDLQPRKGEKKRRIRQTIRSMKLTVLPTQRRGSRGEMKKFTITVVHARETRPPKGMKAVEWFLLTTVDVGNDFEGACEVMKWYLSRWEIELYFKSLKSGCAVEDIQLQKEQRFLSCLALYMVIAWRIMFLLKISRIEAKLSCTKFLEEGEWRAAYIMIKKKKPLEAPTIGEAVMMIARVGGYLARKSDGPPGMKNLWRGLRRIRQVIKYNEIIENLE